MVVTKQERLDIMKMNCQALLTQIEALKEKLESAPIENNDIPKESNIDSIYLANNTGGGIMHDVIELKNNGYVIVITGNEILYYKNIEAYNEDPENYSSLLGRF